MINIKDNSNIQVKNSVILAVDDQPINLEILKCCLEDDYQVVCAASGEEALSTARFLSPDLILLDVMLDGMSGLDVCQELKQEPALQDIPVIFVTSNDSPEDESNCWNAGGNDFILKPIKIDTLGHRVKTHLTIKHQQDRLRKATYKDRQSGLMSYSYLLDQLDQYYISANKDFYFSFILIKIANKDQLFEYIPLENRKIANRKINHTVCSLAHREEDAIVQISDQDFIILLHNADINEAINTCHKAQDVLAKTITDFIQDCEFTPTLQLNAGIIESNYDQLNSGQAIIEAAYEAANQSFTENTLFVSKASDS